MRRLSQKKYRERWSAMSEAQKATFENYVAKKMGADQEPCVATSAFPTGSCSAASSTSAAHGEASEAIPNSLQIPADYTVKKLVQEFRHVACDHASVMANDQARYEMYGKVALLLQRGDLKSVSAIMDRSKDVGSQLQCLKLSKPKLLRVCHRLSESALPLECPPQFRSGRTPELQMTEAEKKDLLAYIKGQARFAAALSVPQCRRVIILARLEKQGLLDDHELTPETANARLDALAEEYNVEGAWQSFRRWVFQTQDPQDALIVKRLQTRATPDVSACTIDVVARAITNLESLLKRCNILSDANAFIPSQCERLCVTDEKGLSARSDVLWRGVISKGQQGTARGQNPDMHFEHITLCSWLPADGSRLPVGVVTPTSRLNTDFQQIFPGAVFQAGQGKPSIGLGFRVEGLGFRVRVQSLGLGFSVA